MPTITTVKSAWQPGPETFTDADARRFDTAMFLGDGTNNGVRGGVVRHGDTSLAVSVNGSDQVVVQPGVAVIPAATGLGVHRVAVQTATSAAAGAIDARNATNPRIDLVVIRASGAIDIITGTPGTSPSAPALPAQAVELGRLSVPALSAGAVTVDSTYRAYATALGGKLLVENKDRLPGSGNQKWQRAVALDTGAEYKWTGAAWVAESRNAACVGNSNAAQASQAYIDGRTITVYINMTTSAALTAGLVAGSLPSTDYCPPAGRSAWGECFNINTGARVSVRIDPSGTIHHVDAVAAGLQTVGTITYVI